MNHYAVPTPQQLAEQWWEAEKDRDTASREMDKLKSQLDSAVQRRSIASHRLTALVGPNTPTKVFMVDGFVVIVELNNGVRRLKVEREK